MRLNAAVPSPPTSLTSFVQRPLSRGLLDRGYCTKFKTPCQYLLVTVDVSACNRSENIVVDRSFFLWVTVHPYSTPPSTPRRNGQVAASALTSRALQRGTFRCADKDLHGVPHGLLFGPYGLLAVPLLGEPLFFLWCRRVAANIYVRLGAPSPLVRLRYVVSLR